MTSLIKLFVATAILLAANTASATVFLRLGADTGGDKIGIISLDGTRLVRVSAGTGAVFEFGKRIQTLSQTGIDVITEIVVGYKAAESDSAFGSLDFQRYMLSLNRFWGAGAWRVGAGLTFHNNGIMKVGGEHFADELQPVWSVDEAVGFTAMIDYRVTTNIQVGLRALMISYHLADETGNSGMVDSNTVGMFFNFLLE